MLNIITKPILIHDLGMLYPNETSKKKYRYGVYKCECGIEFKTLVRNVTKGITQSCGCYRKKITAKRLTKHGMSHSRIYSIWVSIKDRTSRKDEKQFRSYGSKQIKVCDEWKNNFEAFYTWSMCNGYTDTLTIDRINNDGDYEPTNCRWATVTIQARNTRKIRIDNSSGYRGVSFNKQCKKWSAYIVIDGKQKHLGYFETSYLAGIAYDKFVIDNNFEHTINSDSRAHENNARIS